MTTRRRLAIASATIGLLASGIVAATSTGTADAATPPSCDTQVVGILPSGRLIQRHIHNTKLVREKKTAAALPFRVDYMYGYGFDQITGGVVSHFIAHTAGQPAKRLDVTGLTDSPTLTAKVVGKYRPSPKGRLFADSGRFYTYGVDAGGRLTRWTRFTDNSGHLWFANPKVVKSGMGGLKTLSFMFYWREASGAKKDVLYGTTKSGALMQFQVPWSSPAKPKVTTVKKTGFSSYTGLSLSWCNRAGTLGSLIAIDKTHNQARWYTLARQMTPKASNLVRRPLVAPGTEWHLHATF